MTRCTRFRWIVNTDRCSRRRDGRLRFGVPLRRRAFVAHALVRPGAVVRDVAPWWTLACGLQGLWCLAFRPWASKPRHFWVSSALLAAEAAALGVAPRALRAAAATMSAARYWTTHVPLSMHFGWISCASLVNMNSFVAKTCALDTQRRRVSQFLRRRRARVRGDAPNR